MFEWELVFPTWYRQLGDPDRHHGNLIWPICNFLLVSFAAEPLEEADERVEADAKQVGARRLLQLSGEARIGNLLSSPKFVLGDVEKRSNVKMPTGESLISTEFVFVIG